MKQAIPYERIKEIIEGIPNPRTKALVACQYVLGARVGELLPYTHTVLAPEEKRRKPRNRDRANTKRYETQGLLRGNIYDKNEHLEIILPNFKNAKEPEKKGIILKEEEKWLYKIISNWLAISKGEQVFPIRQSRARYLIKKAIGVSSHYLRHSRATHLAAILDAYELKERIGWAVLQTSVTYVHKDPTKTIEKMRKAFG